MWCLRELDALSRRRPPAPRLARAGITEEEFVARIESDDERKAAFFAILRTAATSLDPKQVEVLAASASELGNAEFTTQRGDSASGDNPRVP